MTPTTGVCWFLREPVDLLTTPKKTGCHCLRQLNLTFLPRVLNPYVRCVCMRFYAESKQMSKRWLAPRLDMQVESTELADRLTWSWNGTLLGRLPRGIPPQRALQVTCVLASGGVAAPPNTG